MVKATQNGRLPTRIRAFFGGGIFAPGGLIPIRWWCWSDRVPRVRPRRLRRGHLFACLLVCLSVMLAPAHAQLPGQLPGQASATQAAPQSTSNPASDTGQLRETISQRLNDARIRYQEVRTELTAKTPPSYASFDELSAQQIQLFTTRTVLGSWLTYIDNLKEIQQAELDLENEIQSWSGLGIDEPFPLSLADQLAAETRSKRLERQTEQVRATLEEGQVDGYRKALEQAGPKVRKAAEALENAREKNTDRLRWLLASARDGEEMAEARLQSVLAKLELNKRRIALLNRELDFLEQKLQQTHGKTAFSRGNLDDRLKDIANHRGLLQKRLAEVERQNSLAREQEANARTRLEKELAREGSDQARFRQLFELRQIEAETTTQQEETLKLLLVINGLETILWQERFRTYQGFKESQDLSKAIQNLDVWQKKAREFGNYINAKALLARTLIQAQTETLNNWPEKRPGKQIEQAKKAAYQERLSDLEQLTSSLETIGFLIDRLRTETSAAKDTRSFLERLRISLAGGERTISLIWNYEIFSVDDTIIVEGKVLSGSRPVTLKKVIYGLLLLTVGIWLAGKVSKVLSRLAQQHLKVERSLILLYEKIGQYLAVIIAIVAALGLVQIPFTAFAFLGGALAIGVGFGGQNLINNFMSSLILLIEKPIKVGDMVEIESVLGRVTAIGGRCSTIRRFDGVDLLVPNSHLLEKTVVNRTHDDKLVRYSIMVGVAYGSPTRDVFRILEQVLDEHGLVLNDPKPVVLLEDFAADALLFGLYYWIEVNERTDARVTASDLRHRIDRLFRDAGISIAFPQRDVHLDADNPLKVQLISEQQPKDEAAKTELPTAAQEKPRLPG